MRRQPLAWGDIAVVEPGSTVIWSHTRLSSLAPRHPTLSPVAAYLKQPTLVDFPGRLAAIFFLSGCNFRCGYCHNAALLAAHRDGMTWDRVEQACVNFRKHWADGVVITGGEPTLSPELPELIRRLKRHGFAIKLDTNGSRPDILAAVLAEVDYVALDIKCSQTTYPRLTGFTEVGRIAQSLDLIRYELRTTLLEDFHTDDDLRKVGQWIAGASRLVLQPFLPREDLPDPELRQRPRTAPDRLRAAADLLRPHVREIICRD
ncbi:MAG: anaerobic ribonucleoside-triphosphate reductase activating protein [Kiritimatiellaeota bacterium]|nr:anaerobic ribonucleoside-triphosphate reductase activating protein [Kiritimatiellota bacterium]